MPCPMSAPTPAPAPGLARSVLTAIRRILIAGIVLTCVLALAWGALWWVSKRATGHPPGTETLARMRRSPQWRGEAFTNVLPRVDGSWWEMTWRFFAPGPEERTPSTPVGIARPGRAALLAPAPRALAVTWFGHSSLLLDIDGHRVLIDPVWGERVSPFSFMGPARFFPPPLSLAQLTHLDAIVISHDHYDHLDMPTVERLAARDLRWVVPLGVGAHLQSWGVPAAKIVELDWWESARVRDLTITATPARHFSGRSIVFDDVNRTLWAGWAFATGKRRVFYSGDTALFDGLLDIGKRLGPFDLTMLEVGAYNRLWRDVHLGPEQAVRAHRLLRGRVMLPVHWGLFDLAIHAWTEPIERVLVAAQKEGVNVLHPRPGERVDIDAPAANSYWWPKVAWEPVERHDVHSTGVDHLLRPELPE